MFHFPVLHFETGSRASYLAIYRIIKNNNLTKRNMWQERF